jgi:DNA repair protein RadC
MLAREIFKAAICANASSLIVSHNHPSGPSKPSPFDIGVTRQLIRAGEIIGIRLLDHIIVTPTEDFCAMRESGLLAPWWPKRASEMTVGQ